MCLHKVKQFPIQVGSDKRLLSLDSEEQENYGFMEIDDS